MGNIKNYTFNGETTEYFTKGSDSNSFPDLVNLLLGQYQIVSTGSSIKFNRA